ncbi:MAG: outer membrane beta-barrel protein [Kofleriaceae bacterium]
MSARLGLLVAPLLLASSSAFAQAPGEMEPSYSQPPPTYAPAPPVAESPCNCGEVNPMAHRFAVGINFGGYSVSAADTGDREAVDTDFRMAELSLRYRFTPHFELELLLSGGRQVLEDDSDGELAMGGATLAARYRFRPTRAWNWWLMGGLGGTVIERHDSTEEQRDNASRGHVAFGIGLERRFRQFAIHAELRGLALGERKDQEDMTVPQTGTRPPIVNDDVRTTSELSAGQFTIGASMYF